MTVNNDITKCTNDKCPKAKYCERITAKENPKYQWRDNLNEECFKNGKYIHYIWNGVK